MNALPSLLTGQLDIWTAAETEKKSGRGRSSGNGVGVYGIKKLRELILGLAISGKLLPQETEDTPTIDLIKNLGIKKKILHEVLLHEFPIPDTWGWHYISDLCELKTGATPSTAKKEYYGGQIRWLVSGDVNKSEIYDCEGRITEAGLNNSNCKILPKNSVLIALNGQGKTRATVAILRVEAACNQSLVAIIPKYKPLVLPEFILINLKYRYSEIRDITGQNQRRGLNMGLIGDFSISVPPLAEQHRIIAKVDELMKLCDQLETQHNNAAEAHEKLVNHLLGTLTQAQSADDFNANWQRIAEHFDTLFTTEASIDALKQKLLQLAVMGKLVPQDPNDEPASELLKRIQSEKAKLVAEGKIKKDKPLPPISNEEKQFELPQRWEWVRLEDLMPEFQNGASSRGDSDGCKVIVLRLADIKNRQISLEEPRELLISQNMIEKYCLIPGDILIIRVNGSADLVGGFVVCEEHFDGIYCDHFIRMRISQSIFNPKFLALIGASQLVRNRIKDLFVTTAGQKTVNQGHIGSLIVPILSVNEQHRIVAKVDELMVLCDQLKSRIAQASQLQQKLADVIVEQARVS